MITRTKLNAVLAASEAAIDRIPLTGVTTKTGFCLDRRAVSVLREALTELTDTDLNSMQDDLRSQIGEWAESAAVWKLTEVVAACEAALTA